MHYPMNTQKSDEWRILQFFWSLGKYQILDRPDFTSLETDFNVAKYVLRHFDWTNIIFFNNHYVDRDFEVNIQ